jgi:hypothetical protein
LLSRPLEAEAMESLLAKHFVPLDFSKEEDLRWEGSNRLGE